MLRANSIQIILLCVCFDLAHFSARPPSRPQRPLGTNSVGRGGSHPPVSTGLDPDSELNLIQIEISHVFTYTYNSRTRYITFLQGI